MSEAVAVDFETFYSSKLKYSVKTMIAEQYCRHDLFDPYMVSISDGKHTWAGDPRKFDWTQFDGKVLLSHNSYFDSTVADEMVRRGWIAGFKPAAWHCTANMTAYLCNRRSLADSCEFLLKEKVEKQVRSDANNRRWATFSPEERAAMLTYAKLDALRCHKLWETQHERWPLWEQKLSDITIKQGKFGVQIDVDKLNDYLVRVHDMKMATEGVLPWLQGAEDDEDESAEPTAYRPTSSRAIAEQCRKEGIPCCPVKSDDEEAFFEWETTYGPRFPWIQAVSAWRSLNKELKTLSLLKTRLRPDGTVPFGLLYFGAHTGRWSGTARINFQNPRKKPLLGRSDDLMEMDTKRIDAALKLNHETGFWPEWVRHVIDFRSLIIARPGKMLGVCDLAQIEPRVLCKLAGDTERLALIASGMSVYEAHARKSMGWTGGSLKKEDPGKYALAKARELGLGYQCGWKKFIGMAYTLAGIDITVDDPEVVVQMNPRTGMEEEVDGYGFNSRRIVADYREKNPKVVALWSKLDSAFKGSVGGDFVMTLPSGRKMTYEAVRCDARIEPDEDGKPVRKSVFTARVGGIRKPFYGGKLVENATQATARDVFGHHLVNMDERGWWNLFSMHDEAVTEVDRSVTARDLEHEMSKCPEWFQGCPIAAEGFTTDHYKK